MEDTATKSQEEGVISHFSFQEGRSLGIGVVAVDDDNCHDNHENLSEHCESSANRGDENQSQSPSSLCTRAVTGAHPAFQAVFVCRTCQSLPNPSAINRQDDQLSDTCGDTSKKNEDGDDNATNTTTTLPLCVCQSCADVCHSDIGHEVEYIGVGPCYCDCQTSSEGECYLTSQSKEAASKLGIDPLKGYSLTRVLLPCRNCGGGGEEDKQGPFFHEVFSLPSLEEECTVTRLLDQAVELVRYTKDTFWVPVDVLKNCDESLIENEKDRICELEMLALAICKRHVEAFDLLSKIPDSCGNRDVYDTDGDVVSPSRQGAPSVVCGAEWWVQIKTTDNGTNESEAIDLHYDKDEELAESFGLGSFPILSTVTYFTGPTATTNVDDALSHEASVAAPTIIFPHTYEMKDEEHMSEMLICHPRRGKHLVFDGRMLHGAPSHPALRQSRKRKYVDRKIGCVDDSGSDNIRVTFLANIWLASKPSGVNPLPSDVRGLILAAAINDNNSKGKHTDRIIKTKNTLEFVEQKMSQIMLRQAEDLPDDRRQRIHLPFVSKGATWIDDDYGDEDEGLVLSTFPPPMHESDTVRVQFGPGMEAYLEHVENKMLHR